MIPPEDIEVYNTDLSTMWFDKEGIFCSVTKTGSRLDKNALELSFNFIRKHSGEKKICWISDVTKAPPPDKEAKDFAAVATPGLIKALALITNSSLSIMISEMFFLLKPPPYPVKMFNNEGDARVWLKQFNQKDSGT